MTLLEKKSFLIRGFPEEDVKERRETKDGMSNGTDTGINTGINGILGAVLLENNTGTLEKRQIERQLD